MRRHGRWFEIWETSPVRRRSHRWLARGEAIPIEVLQDFPTDDQQELRDRLGEIIRGEYPEPDERDQGPSVADQLLESVTHGCALLRWGCLGPEATAQLVVAAVRLTESLNAVGCPAKRPCSRSGRRGCSSANSTP